MVAYFIALANLIVCANTTNADERTVQDAHRNSPRPATTARQAARVSQLTRHKTVKKTFQKNKSPKTSLEAETRSRRELKDFLIGKKKSYKGFDSVSGEHY
jgi:hypothetical protein